MANRKLADSKQYEETVKDNYLAYPDMLRWNGYIIEAERAGRALRKKADAASNPSVKEAAGSPLRKKEATTSFPR